MSGVHLRLELSLWLIIKIKMRPKRRFIPDLGFNWWSLEEKNRQTWFIGVSAWFLAYKRRLENVGFRMTFFLVVASLVNAESNEEFSKWNSFGSVEERKGVDRNYETVALILNDIELRNWWITGSVLKFYLRCSCGWALLF